LPLSFAVPPNSLIFDQHTDEKVNDVSSDEEALKFQKDLEKFLNENEEKYRKTFINLFEFEPSHPKPREPVDDSQYKFNPDLSCIEHTVQLGDTLQGLSIKYGTTVQRIKKVNNLFNDNMLYTRKTILIPTTQEQMKSIVQFNKESLVEQQKKEARFMEEQGTSNEIAIYYLKHYNYDYEASVEAYKLDLSKEILNFEKININDEKIETRPETNLLNEKNIFVYENSSSQIKRVNSSKKKENGGGI